MIKLYENIKQLRKQNNWSQEELAKRVGYTDRSTIARIESGSVDLSQSKIMEFARVFDVAPGDLMGWDDFVDDVVQGQVDLDEMSHAIKMYELYKKSNPKVQEMVQYLLEQGNSRGANPQD